MKSFKGSPSGPTVAYSVTVTVTWPSLATLAGGYVDQSIPANPGCVVGQRVFLNLDEDMSNAGFVVSSPRISAANTVRIQCSNATATNPLQPTPSDVNLVFFGEKGSV